MTIVGWMPPQTDTVPDSERRGLIGRLPAPLREWARVLRPDARIDIGVPDARFVAAQWVREEIDTAEANHWILGGHSERAAHQGVDARGVPLWIWNAHHTMFDAESLHAAVSEFLEVEELVTYDIRNLRCYARKR